MIELFDCMKIQTLEIHSQLIGPDFNISKYIQPKIRRKMVAESIIILQILKIYDLKKIWKVSSDSTYLAIFILDSYLAIMKGKSKLEFLIETCFFIACKFEEVIYLLLLKKDLST